MPLRNAPYTARVAYARTGETVYAVCGTDRRAVATVTADGGTERRTAFLAGSAAPFRGYVQDVNQAVHYDGYDQDHSEAESSEFVRECLAAVARCVQGEGS